MDATYRPGQTLVIHWIVTPATSAPATPLATDLDGSLTGPFTNIAAAKASGASQTTIIRATTLHLTDQTGGLPTSRIVIPADTAPGFYNLRTSSTISGNSVGGTGTIQIAAP
jgi:hypothetical protein